MDIKKTGTFIQERRKAINLTQKQLAEKLNVTDKAVSKWERGQGYPEITTIPKLAEILGVTTSEIMLGEQKVDVSFDEEPKKHEEKIVSNTVDYMENLNGQKKLRAKKIAFIILTLSLLTGMFVSGLCNYVIDRTFSWSLYVFSSCAVTFFIMSPILMFKKHALLFSAAGLSISIVPFLYLIQNLCPAKNWVTNFALPIVLISLVSIWAFLLLVTFSKLRALILTAIGFLIFGVVANVAIQWFVSIFLELSPENCFSTIIVAISSAFIAAVLFVYSGFKKNK